MEQQPNKSTLCNLQVVVMPNGEIMCMGKIIGVFHFFKKHLTPVKEEYLTVEEEIEARDRKFWKENPEDPEGGKG